MKIGIFYATNTGFTEIVADKILKKLGPNRVATCQNIEERTLDEMLGYDVLLIGIATWDAGDLPYDWALFYDDMDQYDFSGTRVVMFGLGDQVGYPETFLDAMGIVYRKFLERGAVGDVGFWPNEKYEYFGSLAVYEDKFCGLAIDEDNEPELTDERIDKWCAQIMQELGLIQVVSAQSVSA
ncbi:MAG: flavodoxin [Myxococcota bacterium]|nr:flavodoxin [Myxococcota bacterium]